VACTAAPTRKVRAFNQAAWAVNLRQACAGLAPKGTLWSGPLHWASKPSGVVAVWAWSLAAARMGLLLGCAAKAGVISAMPVAKHHALA
jgi:hypothetical protein